MHSRRCPNGTRRNKKTGNCEETKKPGSLKSSNAKTGRCPNGTRRNKKTGNCEKKNKTPSPVKPDTPVSSTRPSDEILITVVNKNSLTRDNVKKLVSSIPDVKIITVNKNTVQLKVTGSVKSQVISLFPDNVKFVKKLHHGTTSDYETDLKKLVVLNIEAVDSGAESRKYMDENGNIIKEYKAEYDTRSDHDWYEYLTFFKMVKKNNKMEQSELINAVMKGIREYHRDREKK